MASKVALLLARRRSLLPKTLGRSIASTPFLSQEPQLADSPSPLPPKPSVGSPIYNDNWRNPNTPPPPSAAAGLVPLASAPAAAPPPQSREITRLMDEFANLMTAQRWGEIKSGFEEWIRAFDSSGKLNRPDVLLYNHYLRANLMLRATPWELLDLLEQMGEFHIKPNTASYNLVLKAMVQDGEYEAAQKLIDGMMQTGTVPDDESYNLVIELLLLKNQLDSALNYIDLMLKAGCLLSSNVFKECIHSCLRAGRLDTLASVIEKCKATDQNKALGPTWNLCKNLADVALQADHSKLALFSLEYFARGIACGENAKPPILLSVDEGIVVSAMGTAARTYNPTLLDAAWVILQRSLRMKRAPNPETYLSKIHAHASMGQLQRAFSTLKDLETVYGNAAEIDEELFSPFTSLYPLVVACCKNGFSTLDTVYLQLENLSQGDRPFKSVAALNCIILGCANIWDLERAYETFESISEKIGVTPDIHSYNSLICAFGKLKKKDEALKVFDHFTSIGVKPNATTYKLLVDVHLANRDSKSALDLVDEMIKAGFIPSKDTLKKIRRRCSREIDFDNNDRVQSLARKYEYRMGTESRREMLYNLSYSAEF